MPEGKFDGEKAIKPELEQVKVAAKETNSESKLSFPANFVKKTFACNSTLLIVSRGVPRRKNRKAPADRQS